MALITFLSDFGLSDHYVAAVKARIYSKEPNIQLVDISHQIESFNIAHGAFVLEKVFRDFPSDTVHIASVNCHDKMGNGFIALKLEGQLFIGPNNGLFSLISDQSPTEIIDIKHMDEDFTSFPARDLFVDVALDLAKGKKLSQIGEPCTEFIQLIKRHVKATKKQISGNVIRVDHYGNLITNIEKKDFDILSNGSQYSVVFGRENINKITENYHKVEAGDCFLIFNSQGLLEIGINKGSATELLGLGYDSPVNIFFNSQ